MTLSHPFLTLVGMALAAAVVAQPSDPPNIVFIISDQHKVEETGAYGSPTAITPHIDALAETGITFTNCYTPAPVCAPARAALMTGMYPYANGAIYHKAPVKMPNGKVKMLGSGHLRETGYEEGIMTVAEALKQAGYATSAPGKMHVHGELQREVDEDHPEGNYMGFDEVSARYYTHFPGGHYEDLVGTDTYQRYRQFRKYKDVYPKGPMHLNAEYLPTLVEDDEQNFDMVVARQAVDFIGRSARAGQPFFVHVGFEKPHAPFTTTQTYLDMHNPADYSLPKTYDTWYGVGKYPWVPNWVHSGLPNQLDRAQNVMAAYNACITEMDDMVGRVVQALKESGEYDNTIIIYTSDHGEHLFEHGLRGKHCMYEEAVRVPLIISYPKLLAQGETLDDLVSLIDMYPTFCELTGAAVPQTVQGRSLLGLLQGEENFEGRTVFSEFRGADYQLLPQAKNVPSRMLRTGTHKYVYTHGIVDQLYDLATDPDELTNLAMDPTYADTVRDYFFQTVADWRFAKYSPIKTYLKGDVLGWDQHANAQSWSIYYAPTADHTQVEAVATGLTDNQFTLNKPGYYWVLAAPKLVKTSQRYGNTPVAVEEYDKKLPISDPVKF